MKRKIITALLLLVFATSNICGAFANESAEQQTMHGLAEFDALSTMGLLAAEFEAKKVDDTVTRAEFVGSMSAIAGYTAPEVSLSEIPFIDINSQTAYKNELCNFYDMGMIDPVTDSILDATGDITYSQAAKIAVKVLGYDEYTKSRYGDGANGYVLTAQRLRLDDGISSSAANKPLTAQDAVVLMYNAAVSYVMEPASFSGDGQVSYSAGDEKILLSQINDIYYGEGIMQSNGYVSITSQNPSEDRIVIGGAQYEPSAIDYSDYLGYRVEYFYKLDNSRKKLLWLGPSSDSSVLVVSTDELITDDSEYSSSKIVYWDNNRRKTAVIDGYADVIYNNSVVINYTADDLKPLQGQIRLVDNNSDKKYDTVIVEDYKNLAVKSVSTVSMSISGKYGDAIFLEDYDSVRIIKNGKLSAPADITTGCVISYYETDDKSSIFIWVNPIGTTENLSFVSDEDGETVYGFAGGSYKLASSFSKLIDEGRFIISEPEVGARYTYYLDKMGNIADFVQANTGMQYALLIDAKEDDDPFAKAGSGMLKLLLESGEIVVARTAEKLVIDGVSGKTGADLLGDSRLMNNGSVERQVVRLALDGGGQIKKFEFAAECTSPYGYDNNDFTLDYSNTSALYYGENYKHFESAFSVNNDTICFAYYPDWNVDDPYQVVSGTSFSHKSRYNVKLYDTNENREVKVIYAIRGIAGLGTDLFLVDNVTRVWDGENACRQITGVYGGKTVTYLETEEGVIPDNLKRGDLIYIGVWQGRISNVQKLCSLSENPDAFVGNEMRFGQIYSMSGENIVLLKGEGEADKLAPIHFRQWYGQVTISVYDSKSDCVYPGTKNDLYQVSLPKVNGELIDTGRNVKALVVTKDGGVKHIIVAYY